MTDDELRQLVESTAKACAANSNNIAELRAAQAISDQRLDRLTENLDRIGRFHETALR
jgi:hypothetical protein